MEKIKVYKSPGGTNWTVLWPWLNEDGKATTHVHDHFADWADAIEHANRIITADSNEERWEL
jgi:hypothetical protein